MKDKDLIPTQRPKAFYIVHNELRDYSFRYEHYKDAFVHAAKLAKQFNQTWLICKTIVQVTSTAVTSFDIDDEPTKTCRDDNHAYPWRNRCIKCGALSPIWPARLGLE